MDSTVKTESLGLSGALPVHVAIVMDGNGRWAQARGLPRLDGHKEGANSVRSVVRTAREIGIKNLTLFAFSEQNWDRPPQEVEGLMALLKSYILEERNEIMENQIRFTAIGDLSRLPDFVRNPLFALMDLSASNNKMTVCLALSYGGREEIVWAAKKLAEDVQNKKLRLDEIDHVEFEKRLFNSQLPPVDLLIRTSGELRISNFLLWQAAFAEFFFTPTYWPDFRREQFLEAIEAYQKRERRFGLISEQISGNKK